MKFILFLVISGISNGSNTEFQQTMEKSFSDLEQCVKTSIIMRKVLRAEDNLQMRDSDVYAYCKPDKTTMSQQEFMDASNKIHRLEKYLTTEKW